MRPAPATCCPSSSTPGWSSSPRRSSCPRRCCACSATCRRYYLRYYYAHDEVLREQLGAPTRAEAVQRGRARAAGAVRRPGRRHQAGAARAARRRLLLRGGRRPDRVAHRRPRRRAGGQRAQRRHAAVPARRPRDRGAGDGRLRAASRALPIDPLPDDLAGLIAHVAGYERLALDAAVHGGRDRVLRAMLAHPLVGQYDRAERLTDLLLARQPRAPGVGAMTGAGAPLVIAVDGGGSKTDAVALGARRRRSSPSARGATSSPHVHRDASDRRSCVDRPDRRSSWSRPARARSPRRTSTSPGSTCRPRSTPSARAIAGTPWAGAAVDNDLFALLRAGTGEPDAVAVVCGTGINCVGVRADGARRPLPVARHDLGRLGRRLAPRRAARSGTPRARWTAAGAPTVLAEAVPAAFGLGTVQEVIEALHFGRLAGHDLSRALARRVFAARASGDAVAAGAGRRPGRGDRDDGGHHAAPPRPARPRRCPSCWAAASSAAATSGCSGRSSGSLGERAPQARMELVTAAPILGAALLALESAGAEPWPPSRPPEAPGGAPRRGGSIASRTTITPPNARGWSRSSSPAAGSRTSASSMRCDACRGTCSSEARGARYAYEDHPMPIGDGQTISQPYIVALMLEAARIGPRTRCSTSAPARATRPRSPRSSATAW